MVGVVQFEVGQNPQACLELHQRSIRFIGFGYQQAPLAVASVAAEGGHDAADHRGWIVMGRSQQGGNQRTGGGFAMAAGHGDRGLAVDQRSQHIGTVADRQAGPAGRPQLWVGLGHRRADHHQWRGGGAATDRVDGAGALLSEDPHPQPPQLGQDTVVPGIGAADTEAPFRQDPCQGRHADAADADEVKRLATIKRWGQGRLPVGERSGSGLAGLHRN